MSRKLLMFVSALVLSFAAVVPSAEALPDCNCVTCLDAPTMTCKFGRADTSCIDYLYTFCPGWP